MTRVFAGVVLVVLGACSSSSGDDAGAHDSGVADAGTHDAGSCGCSVDGHVLSYSWACFCASGGCASVAPATSCGGTRESQVACGLRSDSVLTPGGPFIQVFDATGALVGEQAGSDTSDYVCPDDASLRGFVRRVGTFPDAGCAVTTCDCVDGGVACPAPPSCGCSVEGDTLTYSWDCFCATHDCTAFEPQALCGLYPPTVACGLRTDQFQNIGGTNLRVFENGVLVGAQLRDDTPSFACPEDSSMVGSTLRAGTFADAGCAVTTCDCVDGGVACPAPPSCGCQSDGLVMTMSWECFCRTYGCDQHPITTCSTLQQAELVCGQRVDDVYPPQRIIVFDDAGVAIGGEVHTDLSDLVCPDDASIHGSVVRAGRVPAPECAKVVCDCIDGGVVCPPPAPSCGCSVEGDTLTYSWDCFCATHDCTAFEPQSLCGLYPPTVACGLRTDQFQNIGGTNLRVFENGVLVGAQLRDDTPSFACPDDSSMVGSTLRAGTFADAGCAVTTCDCVDGGVACP